MKGGIDDNNVKVDDDVCDDNNKGEGDCGEGENKDEVGDDDEDMGEDLFLCLLLIEKPAFFAFNIVKNSQNILLTSKIKEFSVAGSKFKQRLTFYSGVVLMTTN